MAIGEPLAVLGPALTRDLGFQTTLIEKHPTLYGLAAVPLATGWPPTSIRDHSAMSLRCRVSACATTVGLPRQPVSPWSPGSVASWCHCSRAPPPRRWRMYREAAWGASRPGSGLSSLCWAWPWLPPSRPAAPCDGRSRLQAVPRPCTRSRCAPGPRTRQPQLKKLLAGMAAPNPLDHARILTAW